MKECPLLFVFFLISSSSFSQIAEFTFTGASGSPVIFSPDAQPTNGTLSDISRGSGVNAASASGAFSGNSWPTGGFDLDSYFTFSIQANNGFELTLTSIMLEERRSSSGPRDWSIRSSLDAFASDIAAFNVPDDANTRNQTINLTAAFSNVSSSTAIEFRIYAYNAEGGSGSWRLDDIQFFGSISAPDTDPPGLTSSEAQTATTALVQFDEGIDQTTGETTGNYLLNGTTNPTSAVRQGDITQVLLTFSGGFQDGVTNSLQVSGVEDLAGNAMSAESVNFTFTLISVATAGDILINEIMADPTPVVDLPDAEYVELFNASGKNIDLLNYTLNGDLISASSFVLKSGEHVVLTDDSNTGLFTGNVIELSSMGALTNSGETLTLRDVDNALDIDVITYDNSWYNDTEKDDGGYSLERIGPDSGCGVSLSWTASNDVGGGTPGAVNSVEGQEIVIPAITVSSFETSGFNTLNLEFSVDLPTNSLANADITVNDLTISSISPSTGPTYTITFGSDFIVGTIYRLEVDNLENCDGSKANDLVIEFGEGATPQYNQLIITEIMANPNEESGLPEAEYLEVYNPTDLTLSLSQVELSDASSSTILSDALIAPGQYLVLTPNADVSNLSSFGTVLGVSSWPSLNNSGDLISLTINEEIVFSVNYSDIWYKDSEKAQGGFSLEMIDTNNPCGRIENWSATNNANGGTPGEANSIKAQNPDNMGPVLVTAFGEVNRVTLTFNEKLNPANLDLVNFSSDPAIEWSNPTLNRPIDDQLIFTTEEILQARTQYDLSLSNLTDCNGNLITAENGSASFTLTEETEILDLVINEILFNPRSGGVDFVEVFNRSPKHINLKGHWIANKDDGMAANLNLISEENLVIAPGGILAFTEDPVILRADYPNADENNLLLVNLPSYPNDEGDVVLLDPNEVVIDEFSYTKDLHLALLAEVDGVSLERVSSEEPSDNLDNWKSAASTAGFATPGLPNSQIAGQQQSTERISLSPRIITPDNNGDADFTTINYSLSGGNNVVTVTVFDQAGREVRKILDNATVPDEGFVTWDGTNDSRQKVRIGYYIVLFEVFDATGNVSSFKEKVVVGTRF